MSGTDSKSLTIPKFSSFKAKAPGPDSPSESASPGVEEGKRSDERRKERDKDAHRSHRHVDREKDRERGRRHRKDHPRHADERPSRHRSNHRQLLDSSALSDLGSRALVRREAKTEPPQVPGPRDAEALFVIDKRGDPMNSRYHSNDRSKVPNYRRSGRGRVLGSEGYLRTHWDGTREEFAIQLPGDGGSATRDSRLFRSNVRRIRPRRIRPHRGDGQPNAEEQDYVPLKASAHGHQFTEDPLLSNEAVEEGPDYRSIEGKAKEHEFSDSDVDYGSADDHDVALDYDDPIKQRSIDLGRRVKEHPEDIQAWLELINHQDVLLRATEGVDGDATRAAVSSYAEIKLSMYESAMKHVGVSDYQERLLLGTMLEGAKVWPASKLERRWDEIASEHPTSFVLWKARMDSRLSNISKFQYQDIRDMYLDRLRSVPSHPTHPVGPHAGSPTGDGDRAAIYAQLIYVFLRATRFVFYAGYRELSVAAWQAHFELNLFRPDTLHNAPLSEVLESFKEFWENEVPRIGEEGALGWAHFVAAGGDVDPPDPRVSDTPMVTSRDVYKSWGVTEQLRALDSRQPARSLDEGTEDDPYRVIMFSDIESFLFIIPEDLLLSIRRQLVDAFLLFCHLPPTERTNPWTRAAAADPFILGGMKHFEGELYQRPVEAPLENEEASTRLPNFGQDSHHLAPSLDVLFPGQTWFQYLSGWPTTGKDQDGPVKLALALAVLKQLLQKARFEDMAPYYLALERVNGPGTVKKRAKALLKQFSSNICLYVAYALAEWASGNVDVARQVLGSAKGLMLPKESADKLVLWTVWAWIELEAGDKAKAVLYICAATSPSLGDTADAATVTPHHLLSARQTLSGDLGYFISTSQFDAAVSNAELLAMLEYLTLPGGSEPASVAQGNIAAALDRMWMVSEALCQRGQGGTEVHERILQAGARLLYLHASRGPFRSAYLREHLARCIDFFPRNTIFLTLFSWASPSFGIEDPARNMLRNTALAGGNDCVASRVFAIRYELQRGNAHSARAAFEHAMESPACRPNSTLWRCYIRFCCATKEHRDKAKDVFFRGVSHCPWSKELAMEAFTTLVKAMDEFELRSVFNTMASKGMRIHVDLDEFVTAQGRRMK
ncbi:DUF1740-domain-containing protein [Sodiomyces alkalinus F11]|uniref:DUF1740-domain-containing protein n=1 Tax=Sodiomyces alkalinus (strain CBS 110278 / VKM F-3762 / F11) TaxID=1314773 RepID=A0A3N2Q0S1_SODAK|nr:DUF1740-domain-containing protein [Sodiomyces alkalinus F11]ROT40363.1 DUF1740-domain-containing protein [Sodiomyces alkalinus F11]